MAQQSGKSEKQPLFTPKQKKIGCWSLFLVWFLGTTVLTVANWSVMPVIANAFDLSGGWVTVALVFNAILSFIVSGFITGVGMIVAGVGLFVLFMTLAFFGVFGKSEK